MTCLWAPVLRPLANGHLGQNRYLALGVALARHLKAFFYRLGGVRNHDGGHCEAYHHVSHAALINLECLITHINGKEVTSLERLFPNINISS